MHPCAPDPAISESALVVAVPAADDGWPRTPDRIIYDKGPSLASKLIKRSEDLLDYCLDLRRFLEPGETIIGATSSLRPVTIPVLAMPLVEYGPHTVIVWLDGGSHGQSYQITVNVRTSGGRHKLFRFFIATRGDAAIHTLAADPPGGGAVCAGLGPQLVPSVHSLTLADTEVGEISEPVAITIVNTGSAKAVITGIIASDDYRVSSDTGGVVEPGESFTIWVRFAPTAAGTTGGYIVVAGVTMLEIMLLAQAL